MTKYTYKAIDQDGKKITGNLQANNEQELHEKLKADGKFLVSFKENRENVNIRRLKSNIISEFGRNLGELLGSGVTLVKALKIIAEDESSDPKAREIYVNLLKLVRSGINLSDALLEQGDAFPPLFVNMIKSAESSGNMDKVALQMSVHYDKEYKLNKKVQSSMNYPKILGVLIVIVLMIIMGYVIPQFQSLFDQMETLPMSTTILLAISDFVIQKWYVIIIVGAVIFSIFKVIMAFPKVQFLVAKMKIKMPLIGKLQKVIYTARFARTLSSLYSAGISIINCLIIAKTTIDNAYIEKQFDRVIADVRAGENLSTAIGKVDGFTKKLSSSIMVGEETGSLENMLVSIANQMEYDSEMAIDKMVSYIEPAMIVFMAVLVGFIIISVIQPIYGSYETIGASSSASSM